MYKNCFVNLHRHAQHSQFDGYGKAIDAAKHAKDMGQTALGLTDHGTVSGIIEHYTACNEVGIKPILGVEAYFQPKFNQEKKKYHLCIFAMNNVGYKNLSQLLTEANDKYFYRTATVTFELLKKYNEGLIVSSACVAGYIPNMFLQGKKSNAIKAAKKFKEIFGDRFYMEIMPYHLDDCDQEGANEFVLDLGEKLGIECIVTCDSHYTKKEEYDTYLVMHKIAGHVNIADYSERYMPSGEEVYLKTNEMHGKRALKAIANTQKLANRCDVQLEFAESVPTFDWGMPSDEKLRSLTKRGLKRKVKKEGLSKKSFGEYKKRAKYELGVIIDDLGLQDYFLLCYDIVKYAKDNNIPVGPGRGSVCGSLVANLIGITEVDPIVMGTDFERFLRPDKKKLPDIDMDFGQAERHLILEYIMKRHEGRAAQIATFGYYKVKNLANDLAKVYEMEPEDKKKFKDVLEKLVVDDVADENVIMHNPLARQINRKYKNIVKHFCRLYGQVRFIGKHAAGVAITVGPIGERVALMKRGGILQTSFDLNDLGKINVLKMDILGLSTASILHEICRTTGEKINWQDVDNDDVFEAFREGRTEGIFQFEKGTAKEILERIECDNIQDLIAANALNRPAPLQLGVLDDFVEGKLNITNNRNMPWFEYTKESYGTIIFQEHVMRICRNIAHMKWQDVDKVMKSLKQSSDENEDPLRDTFVKGAVKYSGFTKEDAKKLYDRVTLYSFNKGHCAAYSLISYKAMELKLEHPIDFWCATLKFEGDDKKRDVYKNKAVKDGCIIMLPHVNGSVNYEITEFHGDKVIQEGLSAIKGIGEKAAQIIIENGPYIDYPDFEEKWQELPKMKRRAITRRTIEILREAGAFEFVEKKYMRRVLAYNSQIYSKNLKIW